MNDLTVFRGNGPGVKPANVLVWFQSKFSKTWEWWLRLGSAFRENWHLGQLLVWGSVWFLVAGRCQVMNNCSPSGVSRPSHFLGSGLCLKVSCLQFRDSFDGCPLLNVSYYHSAASLAFRKISVAFSCVVFPIPDFGSDNLSISLVSAAVCTLCLSACSEY